MLIWSSTGRISLKILWTKTAERNLEEIEHYISQDNPIAAIKTVLRILKAVEILVTHPNVGRSGRVLGTRELVISGTPYIVPYRIQKGQIEILRVFHAAMQWLGDFD